MIQVTPAPVDSTVKNDSSVLAAAASAEVSVSNCHDLVLSHVCLETSLAASICHLTLTSQSRSIN